MQIVRLIFASIVTFSFSAPIFSTSDFYFLNGMTKESDSSVYVSQFYERNEQCLRCHGRNIFDYEIDFTGIRERAIMPVEYVISRGKFYSSDHKSFSCTDCHSKGYSKFPHPGELRMEPKYDCIDCHEGDEKFAKFKFSEIESQYRKSVHFRLKNKEFTCWECHGPHDSRVSNFKDLKETVQYDNKICLDCHSNNDRFHLFSDTGLINIRRKHAWLPNQADHFRNIRCIDCHAEVTESAPIAHLINQKERAVRECTDCHSENSILMFTLCRHGNDLNSGAGSRDSYISRPFVIGSGNRFLEWLSIAIFSVIMVIIIIHICFRIRRKK